MLTGLDRTIAELEDIVTMVLNTRGGAAPTTACTVGQTQLLGYEAATSSFTNTNKQFFSTNTRGTRNPT